MCWAWLDGNAGPKKSPKIKKIAIWAPSHNFVGLYLHTYRQSEKQCLLHMSPQYVELRLTSGWDRFVSLRHPCKFQRVSRPGSVTARHCSSGRQPNFAELNRGRHLYSAGRPSRWANAQRDGPWWPTFLVVFIFVTVYMLWCERVMVISQAVYSYVFRPVYR